MPDGRRVGQVDALTRLETFVDTYDEVLVDRQMSVSAVHTAVLVDGRHVMLLDDRGWTASGPPDVWAYTTVQDVVDMARTVVGPDEPFDGRSYEDAQAAHWASLANALARSGIDVDGPGLSGLPHDVVLSERLIARLS